MFKNLQYIEIIVNSPNWRKDVKYILSQTDCEDKIVYISCEPNINIINLIKKQIRAIIDTCSGNKILNLISFIEKTNSDKNTIITSLIEDDNFIDIKEDIKKHLSLF